MSLEGSLERYRLSDVLLEIARERRTGILTVQGRQDIVAVSCLEGQVVGADALNQTSDEGLRAVLVSEGLISAEESGALVAEQQAGGGKLGDLLVERRYLGRDQLLAAFRQQTYLVMQEALQWRDGDFKFYSGDEVFCEDGIEPLSVEEILVRVTRCLGARGPLGSPVPELDSIYERVDGVGREPTLGTALSLDERAVWEMVDGRRRAADLIRLSGHSEFRTLLLLHQLERRELIRARWRRQAGKTPPPALDDALLSLGPVEPSVVAGLPLSQTFADLVSRLLGWLGPAAAALLALLVLGRMLTAPVGLVFPFSWQQDESQATVENWRSQALTRIDRGARTIFLLDGRFPGQLTELVDLGLLSPSHLDDPEGGRFGLLSSEASYLVRWSGAAGLARRLGSAEGVAGDLLLDPQFLRARPQDETSAPPLVLLD